MPYEADQFDWDLTDRKVMLLVPNYGRKKLLSPTIKHLETSLAKKDWGVLIANDGLVDDFSDIESDNIFCINYRRPNPEKPRNGLFIRNYCLRRMQSELVFQKDPEIIIHGDFFLRAVMSEADAFRPRKIIRLSQSESKAYRSNQKFPKDPPVHDIRKHAKADFTKTNLIDSKLAYFFHYLYGIRLNILKSIRGYDEDFKQFGKEDKDLFGRLTHMNLNWYVDELTVAYHMHHATEDNHRGKAAKMGNIFKEKDPKQTVRNNLDWGSGK